MFQWMTWQIVIIDNNILATHNNFQSPGDRAVDDSVMLTDDVSMRTMKVMIPGPMNTRKLREAVADCGAQVVRSCLDDNRDH
jgi:hypothetical protein